MIGDIKTRGTGLQLLRYVDTRSVDIKTEIS